MNALEQPETLISAMAACGYTSYYQPIVKKGSTAQRQLVAGYESLCRQNFRGVILNGADVVRAARQTNTLGAIDAFMAAVNMAIAESIDPGQFITINVSATTLINPLFAMGIRSRTTGSNALIIEITESENVKAGDFSKLSDHVDALREVGWRVAIDDFGDGYSSLRYLNRMNIDMVKLSRETLLDLRCTKQAGRLAFMKDLVSSVQRQSIVTVLEGIETEAELEIADRLGVDLMQGFMFGRPTDRNRPGIAASKLMPYARPDLGESGNKE